MPAKSERQRKFMGAELSRKRAGKATQTEMTEEELEDFASKQLQKISVGAREEGVRPKLPDHLLPRKPTPTLIHPSRSSLGPHRELKKQQEFLKFEVDYKPASPEQLQKGEKCDTCMYWKDGGACSLVVGSIHADMWCDKWEKSTMLQGEHAIAHSQRRSAVQQLQKLLQKEDGGDGGGLAGGATVFTSTNSGVFTPTHGGSKEKPKKKKTGIERLGQFITDNSPEKKMVKSAIFSLTKLLNEVRLELRKDDEKRQTPPRSKATPDDPPQVVHRGNDDPNSKGLPDDPNLVYQQNMTEKEQTRIMNETQNKDSEDPRTFSKKWASGRADINPFHRGGVKDTLEADEDRNEPETKKLK